MIRLAIRVARAEAEIALAELLELVPAGVEEVDHGDTVEYAVYGAEGELPSLPDLRAAAGAALVEVTTTQVADDWASRWRDFHVPVTIGGRLHVRPPWCEAPAAGVGARPPAAGHRHRPQPGVRHRRARDDAAVPGGCCSRSPSPGGALVDLGCGSGVLAIAAAKLGWGPSPASTTSTRPSRLPARTRRPTASRSTSPTATCCTAARPRRARRPSSRTCCARCSPTSREPASRASRRGF